MEAQDKPLAIDEEKEFIDVDGLRLPSVLDPEAVRRAMDYKPESGRIVVASYPRSGTHWTLTMVSLLLRRGEPIRSAKDYFNSYAYMEQWVPEGTKGGSSVRCLYTHLPFDRMTYSPDAKYICVVRHPADVFVSAYHFHRFLPVHEFPEDCFEALFDLFVRGRLDYGDYFEHLLSWSGQRHLPNLLFLTFESMREDHEGALLKIAKFLDENLVDELMADDGSLLKRILGESSLASMQQSTNSFFDEACSALQDDEGDLASTRMRRLYLGVEAATKRGFRQSSSMVRKGKSGEGELSLSEEQKRRLNARMLEKTALSAVMNLWKEDSMLRQNLR